MKKILALTETLAAVFLLLIALLTAGNVLMRDLFSVQIPDWFDGSKLLQGIALFWGFAVTTYYGSHICVDVLWEHLKPARQRLLDLMATTVTLIFLGVLAWMVWVKVGNVGKQTTSDLQIRLDYFYAVAAVGATAAVVLAALRLVDQWRNASPEMPSENQFGS